MDLLWFALWSLARTMVKCKWRRAAAPTGSRLFPNGPSIAVPCRTVVQVELRK